MVTLTRITGATFALNPDLIERVDRTPDTVITLVDGTKYLVRESLDEVVGLVIDYRAKLINAAGNIEAGTTVSRTSRLAAVPDAGADQPADADADADTDEQVVEIIRRTSASPRTP
jgi:flagellar protein FlbD